MPPHLFRNVGKGRFEEVTNAMGAAFAAPRVGRGAAYADINNDGRLDLLLSTNGGPAFLFRNEAQGAAATNHSLRIKLIGTKSNRDGIGAHLALIAGGRTQIAERIAGSGYLSQDDGRVHFGLGSAPKIDKLTIHWPSGKEQVLENLQPDRVITVEEPR